MIKETSLDALQRKLGTFLSLSYDAGISMDVIDEALERSPYFDFLEENRADEFLNDSYGSIAEHSFGSWLQFDESRPLNAELLWVGFSYIDLSIRMKKPLRQLLLLCPPSEMLTLFSPYHEMSETALCDYFQKEIYARSILKRLLNSKKMSVPSLAFYCGCSVPLIWSYCVSNDHLFAASERNINSISDALSVSNNLFKEKSSFVYYSSSFLLDDGFCNLFGESLKTFLGIKKAERPFFSINVRDPFASENHGKTAIMVTYLPIEESTIKKIVNRFGALLFIGPASTYYESRAGIIKKKALRQNLVDLAFKYSCYKNTLM